MTPARVRRPGLASWAALLGFGAATAALFVASFGRWCDAVVDVGSEWVFADTLARGGLLYRDVVYWFGPFTPYFEAAFFRLLGSSFASLVVAGALGSLAALVALFLALRRVTTRWDAGLWVGVAIPALVFMPNSGGAILAMGHRMWHAAVFALLAGAVAARPSFGRRRGQAILAGALAALSGLCRTEWGLAAAGAIALGLVVPRKGSGTSAARAGLLVVLSGAALWLAVIGLFAAAAGPRAVIGEGQLLLTGLSPETREFLRRFSGLPDWPRGVLALLRSAALWLGAFLGLELATLPRADARRTRRRLLLLLACLATIVAAQWGGARAGSELFSAAPLVCAAALGVGLLGRGGRRSRAFVVFGALGLLLSFRRPLDLRDLGYVAPPMLFAVVCAAGLLRRAVLASGGAGERRRLIRSARIATAGLAAVLFAWRFQIYAADGRIPVVGTAGVLRATPAFAREIAGLGSAIRSRTGPDDGLVVIPEGAVLNFLTARRNPIRYKLLIPGYLTERNEAEVVAALEAASPAAIVTWRGPSAEYGREVFGVDYGRVVSQWISQRYDSVPFEGRERKVLPGPTTLWIRAR